MSHQPTRLLFPGRTTRQILISLGLVSLGIGFWIAHHRWAYALGDAITHLAWLHPVLPAPIYGAGVGISGLLGFLLLRRRKRWAALAVVVPGLVSGQLLWGPLYPPTLLIDSIRLALGTPGGVPGLGRSVGEGCLAALGVFAVTAFVVLIRRDSRSPSEIAHGSSRPATYRELKDLDMLGHRDGAVVLGSFARGTQVLPVTDTSDHHVLILMPSGAGKTSGPLVSTLLTNLDSAVVLDPKRELFELTAGWRAARGHRVIYFSPTTKATLRWNPLAEITLGDSELAEIQILADNLVTYPASHREDHWTSAARDLFRLMALHTLYSQGVPTLGTVRTLLSWSGGIRHLCTQLMGATHNEDWTREWVDPASGKPTQTHPEVLTLARRFHETPQREMGSIVSTLQNFLSLWGDPLIQANTSGLDFSVDDLLAKEPVTLYVALPYGDLKPLAPLLRMFLALLTRRLTRDPELLDTDAGAEANRPPIHFVLDEFASLGRVPILEEMLAFFRGYSIRTLIAVQDLPQLHRLYGTHESITGNCQIHVCASTLSPSTRRHASRLSGETTVRYHRRAVSKKGGFSRRSTTVSPTEVKRQLLTEGEIGTLPPEDLLIYKTGAHPILARKAPYWKDPELLSRTRIPAPEPVRTNDAVPGAPGEDTVYVRDQTQTPSPRKLDLSGDRGSR